MSRCRPVRQLRVVMYACLTGLHLSKMADEDPSEEVTGQRKANMTCIMWCCWDYKDAESL